MHTHAQLYSPIGGPSRLVATPLVALPPAPRVAGLWNRWFPAFVSAALLLLTLGIAAGVYWRMDRGGSRSIGGSVIQAPATPSPAVADDSVLFEVPLPADVVPQNGFGTVGIRFFVMAPNSTATWTGEVSDLRPSIWATHVIAGSMTVTADAASEVVHSDDSSESVPPGTAATLSPGDTALYRTGKALEWTSTGSTEVQFITLAVSSDYLLDLPLSNDWQETGYDIEYRAAMPPGAWLLRLEALDLESDGEIAAPASPSMQFGVAGPESDAYVASGPDGELTLRGADTTTRVYVFTIEQTEPAPATPAPATPTP